MAARHRKAGGMVGVMVPAKSGGEPDIQIPGRSVMESSKKKTNRFKDGGSVSKAEGGGVAARMDKPRRASGGNIGVIGAGMAGDKDAKGMKKGGRAHGKLGQEMRKTAASNAYWEKKAAKFHEPARVRGSAGKSARKLGKAEGGSVTFQGRSPISSANSISAPAGKSTH